MAVNLTIENMPDELVDLLRKRARRNHRSMQEEVLAILREVVAPDLITLDEARDQIRQLGLQTDSEAVEMVREDRERN